MTSLAEAYGSTGSAARRRLLLGTGLFLTGAVMVVVAIVVASTGILGVFGVDMYGAREVAGVLAGLGVPAVFVGFFSVLPASTRERAAAAIGATIAVLGVGLFTYAYPTRWIGVSETPLTFPVVVVYFLGAITTFWTLFTAIVNFKAREPGGTVTLQRIIQRASAGPRRSPRSPGSTPRQSSFGSVGVLGDVDTEEVTEDDDAEVLTAPPGGSSGASTHSASRSTTPAPGTSAPASDGGSQSEDIRTPRPAGADTRDRYCGNCAHFEYVPTDEGIQPYCGFHEELMDDMEACPEWDATEFVQ